MKLSVIIPNLNSGVIDRTLEALEQQAATDPDVEVIVVGVDAPGLVRPSRLVRMIDTGRPVIASVARNLGIGASSGEILCFLDADCVPCADWLRRIASHFANDAEAILGGGVATPRTAYWPLCEHISSFHEYLVSAPAGTRDQLPSLNLSMRRAAQQAIGLFDESRLVAEDSDLTTRCRIEGLVLRFDPMVAVEHRAPRASLREVLDHEWLHGRLSIKVDARWQAVLRPPPVLRNRSLLVVASPFIAVASVTQIFARDPALRRWWYAVPGVWLLKMAWCWGAQAALRARRDSTSPPPVHV